MNCKRCNKKISEKLTVHFSNRIAKAEGYCWFGCMLKHLGKEKALEVLNEQGK